MPIKISVVVPTYRRPSLLKNCISALVNQRFDNQMFEIIVVTDGPDESTRRVIEKFSFQKPIIRFLSLSQKKGPAAARNLGWQHAQGTLVAFTDDDCLPDKDWLANAWGHYREEEQIVYSGRIVVPVPAEPTDHELNTRGLETAEFITANCICSLAALQKSGGFDERFALAWREDSDLHFRLIETGIPIVKIPKAIVVHPVRTAPWGYSLKEQKKGMYNALLYKKYPGLYRQKIQRHPAWNYYIIILAVSGVVAGLITGSEILTLAGGLTWLLLTAAFIRRRLMNTSKSTRHVTEMVITSLAIPFLSVYWQLYGAVKYRVWFM